jgi:hypothetical protein
MTNTFVSEKLKCSCGNKEFSWKLENPNPLKRSEKLETEIFCNACGKQQSEKKKSNLIIGRFTE